MSILVTIDEAISHVENPRLLVLGTNTYETLKRSVTSMGKVKSNDKRAKNPRPTFNGIEIVVDENYLEIIEVY